MRPPGPKYGPGGIVFVQINPGYAGNQTEAEIARKYARQHNRDIATRKAIDTRELIAQQSRFLENPGEETYNSMRDAFMVSMSEYWGWPPGKYGKTIRAHGVTVEEIAVINLAQCPVPDNRYQRRQLDQCWSRWTSRLMTLLRPRLIVAQGVQVSKFLRDRVLPAGAKLIEGVHHADRRGEEEKENRLAMVRETISQYLKSEGRNVQR